MFIIIFIIIIIVCVDVFVFILLVRECTTHTQCIQHTHTHSVLNGQTDEYASKHVEEVIKTSEQREWVS